MWLLTKSLQKFDHPYAHREFEGYCKVFGLKTLKPFKKEEKIIESFLNEFKKIMMIIKN